MCSPEDPLFTPLLLLTRVPFQAKESVHKTPFWENLEILASTASIFTQILAHKPSNLEIFSSQALKFVNFQLTSPQICKFSAHKPPNLEIFRSQAPLFRGKCQFASPTLRKSGPHTPTWKKVECPPPRWTGYYYKVRTAYLTNITRDRTPKQSMKNTSDVVSSHSQLIAGVRWRIIYLHFPILLFFCQILACSFLLFSHQGGTQPLCQLLHHWLRNSSNT